MASQSSGEKYHLVFQTRVFVALRKPISTRFFFFFFNVGCVKTVGIIRSTGNENKPKEKVARGTKQSKQRNSAGFHARIWAQLKFYYKQAPAPGDLHKRISFCNTPHRYPTTSLRTRPKKRRSTTEFRRSFRSFEMESATYNANRLNFEASGIFEENAMVFSLRST